MTVAGADWGGGYVTDIAYLPGYYRQQSPAHLHLACLLGGVAGIEAGPGAPLTCLELGCGHGFGALALAAANPGWQVVGLDFNPTHIAAARALAAEAGIANARFIEADLATFAGSPLAGALPATDVATLHGLWSWVGDPVRAGIVRLLDLVVRPGGIVYVSYNALPAWGSALGLQRLLREAGARLATGSDRQVAAGIEIARALRQANAHHLRETAFVQSLLDIADRYQPAYLAHEYMNAAWRPCFHADVVAAFAAAKLDWVASAQLLENFSPLMLDEEMRRVLDRFGDPVMRELVKDMCVNRSLRQDVFVRGARRLGAAARDRALGEVVLALSVNEPDFVWELDVPAGRATIERGFFGPIVAALAEAPHSVRDLLALPDLPRRDNPAEVVGILVGSGQALPLSAPPAPPEPPARRLNQVAARHFARLENLDIGMALATSGSGAPFPCPMIELFVAGRLQQGEPPDPTGWAEALAPGHPLQERQRLAAMFARIVDERAAIWSRFGALCRDVPP